MVGKIAEELKFNVLKFPADWKNHGLGAGNKRNQQMVDVLVDAKKEKKHTIVLAFHEDLEKSKGTKRLY
jgi:hypothetical protein